MLSGQGVHVSLMDESLLTDGCPLTDDHFPLCCWGHDGHRMSLRWDVPHLQVVCWCRLQDVCGCLHLVVCHDDDR